MSGGAAEQGRALRWLLTSDEGRLNRKPFWLFLLAICALATLLLAVPAFRRTPLAVSLFHLALLFPCYCVFAKRLQDIDIPGKWAMAVVLIAAGDVLMATPILHQTVARFSLLAHLWWWLSLANALIVVILGLIPGTEGPNRYGLAA